MRKLRNFRPTVGDVLEDRAVPTGGGGGGGGLGGLLGSIPAQDAQKVIQDFVRFDVTYAQDVNSILFNGAAPTTATRMSFDTAIGNALNDLNTAIDKDIANLPTASTLDTTIKNELIGTDPSTLQSKLAAVTTPTGSGFGAEVGFLLKSARAAAPVIGTIYHQVASAPAPAGAIDATTVRNAVQTITQAFDTFRSGYQQAVKTDLMGSTPDRAKFDSDVAGLIQTLDTTVKGALPSVLPSSLSTGIDNLLLSNTTDTFNLQDNLKGLSTPTAGNRFSTFIFNWASNYFTAAAEGQVLGQFVNAVRTYNNSLGG